MVIRTEPLQLKEDGVSCRLTVSLIAYLKKQQLDPAAIFDGLTFPPGHYRSLSNWIPEEDMALIEDRAMALANDNDLMYRVGLQLPLLNVMGRFQRMFSFLVNPLVAYRCLAQYSALFFDRVAIYKVNITGDNSVEVSITKKNGSPIRKSQSDFIRGVLASVTTIWGLPPAQVEMNYATGPGSRGQSSGHSINFSVSWESRQGRLARIRDRIWPSIPGIQSHITELEYNFNLLKQRNEELAIQNEQLAIIREIAFAADSSKSIDDVYRGVVDRASKIPGMRFLILLQKDANNGSCLQYSSSLKVRLLTKDLKSSCPDVEKYLQPSMVDNFCKAVENQKAVNNWANNPRIIIIERLSQLMGCFVPVPVCDSIQKFNGADKIAIVPVLIEGKEWGTMVTLIQDSVNVRLLEMVASHLALAAKNVYTMQYLEYKNTELAILNEFSMKITGMLDRSEIFKTAESEIQRVFNAVFVSIYSLDEMGASLTLSANSGDPDRVLAFHQYLENDPAFLHGLINSGPETISGASSWKEQTEALLGWPFIYSRLQVQDRPCGFVVIGREQDKQFSHTESSLLTAICHQVSASIETARLHEDILLRMRELEAAKNEIKSSEEKLYHILESLDVGIITTDPDGRMVYINEAAVILNGCTSKSELIGTDFIDMAAHNGDQKLLSSGQLLLEFSGSRCIEYMFARRDGSRFLGEMTVTTLLDNEEKPRGFVISLRDIDQRKLAESKLRESEEKYRTIFDSASDAMFFLDKKGNILDVNRRISEIAGFDRETFLGRNITRMNEIMPRGSTAILLKNFVEQMSGGYVPPFEITLHRKNGEKAYVEVNAVAIKKDGSAVNDLAILRDITQRKTAEREVKKKQEMMYRIITSIPNSVVVINRNMEVVLVNKAFCETFRYNKGEAEGKPLADIIDVPQFCVMAQNIFSEKNPDCQTEFAYTINNRNRTFVAVYIKMSREDALISISDLTEERQKQETMYLTDRLVSVGEMASGIAHELNNPLTSVVALSQMVAQENLPQGIKEDVMAINSEAQRAATVVRNLLSFARKHMPERQYVQINTLIEDVLQLRAFEHKNSQITVNRLFDLELPEIMVDYYQMQQVFLNIVLNAEQAMIDAHKGGKLVVITQRIYNHIKVMIADDGPGISRENLGKIFDPFFTTKEVGKGTGMGLSISYGIVRNHGGRIYAESRPDKGTTFVVELPLN